MTSAAMEQVSDPKLWRERLKQAREAKQTIGLVPTMGALHQGHLSLVDAVRQRGANFITLSIFVNPTQFNDQADLASYPRQLSADLNACRNAGVDLVFTPSDAQMRQQGRQTEVVPPQELCAPLEGAHRPGHFTGMATVVTKLLVLGGPCIAIFGKKDYQQLAIIRRLQRDLLLDAEIAAGEIVRESSGLACSSRNARLSSDARHAASNLYKGLVGAQTQFEAGERNARALRDPIIKLATETFDLVDYVEVVEQQTLRSFDSEITADAVVLCAVWLEGVRLIDNLELTFTDSARG